MSASPQHDQTLAEQVGPRITTLTVSAEPSFGPPSDIAAGWDGTLWAIDSTGAPHRYDPSSQAWDFFGRGIDALAGVPGRSVGSGGQGFLQRDLYAFRGPEVVELTATTQPGQPGGAPRRIRDVWPQLPVTFSLGVDGAAEVGGALYLFKAGRYMRADGSQAPVTLADLPGWPKTGPWQDGLVDLVVSFDAGHVALIRGKQLVLLDPSLRSVNGLSELSANYGGDLLARLEAGKLDALLYAGPGQAATAVAGPAVLAYASPTASQPTSTTYLPRALGGWPRTWHPMLRHAPSGRLDGLWAATQDEGRILHHDGTGWRETSGRAVSVAAGADGSVFCIGTGDAQKQLYRFDGSGWTSLAQAAAPLAQVAVGDNRRVWVRDGNNAVQRLDETDPRKPRLAAEPLVGQASHIDANADGTVWSCQPGGSALRFVSGSTIQPQAVTTGGATKVTSTRYGRAYVLVQQDGTTQVRQYDSPYVFKTSQLYPIRQNGCDPIEQGLGNVYFTIEEDEITYVVALDAQTGREVSRSAPPPADGRFVARYIAPVFDPIHDVVIVGVQRAFKGPPNHIRGLDARDLTKVRWSVNTPNDTPVLTRPTLQDTQLCFTNGSWNTIVMYDTGAARGDTPTYRWSHSLASSSNDDYALTPPVIANGKVYAARWVNRSFGQEVSLIEAAAVDGSDLKQTLVQNSNGPQNRGDDLSLYPPLVQQVVGEDKKTRTVFFVSGGNAVWAVDVAAPQSAQSYALPNPPMQLPTYICTGFEFANGVLWFGDNNGNLYAIDARKLTPVFNTPVALSTQTPSQPVVIRTPSTPVVYQDAQGRQVVFVGSFRPDENVGSTTGELGPLGLLAFDPATGQNAFVPTGATRIGFLSNRVTNGVLYAGGTIAVTTHGVPDNVTQVFGIRVDGLAQNLRDFIIESQLMQDFDGPPTPNGVARYQTHLTIVDETRTPRSGEGVKIWADRPMTVLVNGQRYAVGPADQQCAAVQSGADGTLTIVSGSVAKDGGDKPDLFAPALRVWASFMDPHERILVQPDREFHNRLATAHATAGDDDPLRVNLQGASAYGHKPLFTADQQQTGAPQQVAQAIQNMTRAVGIGSGGANATAWVQRRTDTQGRYIAYRDLPGIRYSPVNVRNIRAAIPLQPLGLRLSIGDAGDRPLTRTNLTPAAAAAAIDQLQGADWKRSRLATEATRVSGGAQVADIWSDFWGWLKQAAATVTDVITSVANDILVGIRFIVDGVAHVFAQVVQTLEDVVSAVGSFFKQLAIDIQNAIEALSILFHFDEIIKTHRLLKQELLKIINGVDGKPAYPGIAKALTAQVKPALDDFFKQGEKAVSDALNALADQIAGQAPAAGATTGGQRVRLNDLKGAGATTHTAFSVRPKGDTSSVSVAPQCTWGMHKLQAGIGGGGAQLATTRREGTQAAAGDPLEAFFTGFLARLTGDGNLNSQWAKLQAGAGNLGAASTPGDFLRQGVAELIRAVALLVDGAMAVANAFLDGFIDLIADLLKRLFDEHDGLLTQAIDIPVVSWLYQHLFGEPLSVLDAVMLVAAIPVTVVWRLVKGEWPSQSLGSATTATGQRGASPVVVELLGIFGGIGSILAGILSAIADISGLFKWWSTGSINALKAVLAYILIAVSIGVAVVSFPLLASTDPPEAADWVGWGVALCIAPAGLLGVPGLFFAFNDMSSATKELLPKIVSWIVSILSLVLLCVAGVAYSKHKHPSVGDDVAFGYTVASCVPGLFNPLTLFGKSGEILVAALDLVMGVVVGVLIIIKSAGGFGPSRTAEVRV